MESAGPALSFAEFIRDLAQSVGTGRGWLVHGTGVPLLFPISVGSRTSGLSTAELLRASLHRRLTAAGPVTMVGALRSAGELGVLDAGPASGDLAGDLGEGRGGGGVAGLRVGDHGH